MEIETVKILQTIIIDSTSDCHCEFALPQGTLEKYCVNVVPASGYTCEGGCTTLLTPGLTTVATKLVEKTHTTESDDEVQVIASTTGTIKVNLFYDKNLNDKQDGEEPNFKNLKVTLITLKDGKEVVQETITSECVDKVFDALYPGTYKLVAEQAQGYTCDCVENGIVVYAGEKLEVDFKYFSL